MLNKPVPPKPNDSINFLLKILSKPSRVVEIGKGALISLNDGPEHDCFLIHQGTALVRRSDNNLIVGHIDGPFIFGFNMYLRIGEQIHIESITDVFFEVVPCSQFYESIHRHHLWEHLLDVTMYLASILYRKNALLTIRDSATIISHQLTALMAEHHTIRMNTCVHDYIHQRTHLSRSGIMKHLAIMRKNGYIEMKDGFLLSVLALPSLRDK